MNFPRQQLAFKFSPYPSTDTSEKGTHVPKSYLAWTLREVLIRIAPILRKTTSQKTERLLSLRKLQEPVLKFCHRISDRAPLTTGLFLPETIGANPEIKRNA